ncbi:MAG: relaxase/mobilization nuclease domain-containing protein [Oscillospiraceae bacterium]
MAVTDIHPISVTLDLAIDYIINPEKTDDGVLVSCIGCSADGKKAAQDFMEIREMGTGRGSTLAQHMYQSFRPGEVTPQQAHALGVRLAEDFLKGQYQYIVATHVDKAHIHNHIIFNNIGYNHLRSFEYKNNRGGNVFEKLQKASDKICKDNDLSVIENPELGTGKSYYEWMQNREGQSWKSKLKFEIDNVIMQSENFEDFLDKCRERDIEYVYRPENKITLKFRMPGQERYCRARTLGWWYDEPQIRRRIEQYKLIKGGQSIPHRSHLIDTTDDRFKDEKYLKRWADIQNMKEVSKILNYLTEQGVSGRQDLEDTAISKYGERVQLVADLNDLQKHIDELSESIKLIQLYFKFKEQKKDKNNAAALKKYNSIKKQLLLKFPDKKLPNIERLYEDRTELIAMRNEKNSRYKKVVSELKELDNARSEIQKYLNGNEKNQKKKKELE